MTLEEELSFYFFLLIATHLESHDILRYHVEGEDVAVGRTLSVTEAPDIDTSFICYTNTVLR